MIRTRTLGVVLLLLAIPILFFHESLFTDRVLSQADVLFALDPWRTLAPPGFQPSNWDLYDQTLEFFPWLSFARDQIRSGTVPLWNPYQYSGSPLLANGQSAVFSPFHLLFYVFPFLKMFSVSACLRLFLAGFFMYQFVRSLGVGSFASLFSAVAYQTCGFLILWLQFTHSFPACFLPLLFWLTERLCQHPSRRRAAFLALAIFLQLISGQIPIGCVQTLVVLGYGIYRSKAAFAVTKFLLPAVLLGMATGSFVLFPSVEYALHSHALRQRLSMPSPFFPQAEDLKSLPAILFPWLYGTPLRFDQVETGPRDFHGLNAGFVGIVALPFALSALFERKKKKRFFVALVVIAFGAAYHLPVLTTLLDLTRLTRIFQSVRWLLFSAFAISVLAGIGMDAFSSTDKPSRRFTWAVLFLSFLIAFGGIGIFLTRKAVFPEVTPEMFSFALFFTAAFVLALLLLDFFQWRGVIRNSPWKGAVLVLLIFEHFCFGFRYNPTLSPDRLFPKTGGIEFLQSLRETPFRILSLGHLLLPNTGMVYRLQGARGYDGVEYDPYIRYLAAAGPLDFNNPVFKLVRYNYYDSPLIDLLNVKYLLSTEPLSGDFLRLRYNGEFKIYENQRAFPRAYLFKEYEVVPEAEEQLRRLTQVEDTETLGKTVFLQESPPLSGKRADKWEIHWVLYQPNRLLLDVISNGSSILFLSEIDYPGWRAYLDGEEAEILRANTLFRSVALPAGTHRLEMRYDPLSFKAGLLLSGVAFLLLVLLIFLP